MTKSMRIYKRLNVDSNPKVVYLHSYKLCLVRTINPDKWESYFLQKHGWQTLDKRIESPEPWKTRLISMHPALANGTHLPIKNLWLNSPRVRLNSDGTHRLKEFKCLLPSISFLATGHCCTIAKPVTTLRAREASNQHRELGSIYLLFEKQLNMKYLQW